MILKDKVSVVTGGGQGLGRAIAIELAKRESSVAVCDVFTTYNLLKRRI